MPKQQRRGHGGLVLACAAVLVLGALHAGTSFLQPTRSPSRREILAGGAGALAAALGAAPSPAYELPPLGYDYDALEPVIDKETMMFHHDKHHATYIGGINKAFGEGEAQPPLLDLIKGAIKSGKKPYRNAGGGVWNHDFFWLEMTKPGTGGAPSAKLQAAIDEAFGSMDGLKEKFAAGAAPAALFGSGWAWVVVKDGKLEFTTTANQDNPLMEGVDAVEGIPILGLDVWEHAYYLKYQNRRPDYVAAWWDVVNWNQVNSWYEGALEGKAPVVDAPPAAAALVGRKGVNSKSEAPPAGGAFSFKFNLESAVKFGS